MKYSLQAIELTLNLGVPYTERQEEQTVLVDVDFTANGAAAAQTDQIEDAVDYQKVYDAVKSVTGEFDLLERVAGEVMTRITALGLPMTDLQVMLTKFPFEDATVTITATA